MEASCLSLPGEVHQAAGEESWFVSRPSDSRGRMQISGMLDDL